MTTATATSTTSTAGTSATTTTRSTTSTTTSTGPTSRARSPRPSTGTASSASRRRSGSWPSSSSTTTNDCGSDHQADRGHRLRGVVRRADRERLMGPRRGSGPRTRSSTTRSPTTRARCCSSRRPATTTHNNDGPSPAVPASYDLPNIISVAALDNDGRHRGLLQLRRTFGRHRRARRRHPEHPAGRLDRSATRLGMARRHLDGRAPRDGRGGPDRLVRPGPGGRPGRAASALCWRPARRCRATVGLTVTGRTVDAYRALDTLGPIGPAADRARRSSRVRSSARRRSSTRVGWPAATDDLTGISAYGVGLKIDGGAWQTYVSSTKARDRGSLAQVRAHVHVPRPGPRRRRELGTAGSRPAPRAEALPGDEHAR